MQTTIEAVAIDGPAGAGKSSVAKAVAAELNYLFVDTGAMYRAVTLAAMRSGTELASPDEMGRAAKSHVITFDETGTKVFLDGEDVSMAIRDTDLTANVKYAARSVPVRRELVARQQKIAEGRPVVMEGRDITTVVLKNANHKFYLDASVECRALRRLKDLEAAGKPVELEEFKKQIAERDRSDFEREEGPLKRTDDQTYLDTSDMTRDEVIAFIVGQVKNHDKN